MLSAVFLDRDGVINENRDDHVKCWQEFRFLPGVLDAVAQLSHAGMRVFVITNQAVINLGHAERESIEAVNERMREEVRLHGGAIEAVAYCPHRPDEACACRKPRPGLVLDLAWRYAIDLSQSA